MPLAPAGTGATIGPIAEPLSRFASTGVLGSGDPPGGRAMDRDELQDRVARATRPPPRAPAGRGSRRQAPAGASIDGTPPRPGAAPRTHPRRRPCGCRRASRLPAAPAPLPAFTPPARAPRRRAPTWWPRRAVVAPAVRPPTHPAPVQLQPNRRWPPRPRTAGHATVARTPISLKDLEERFAGRALAWVGGLALVAAAVFFLSLAFSRGWINEPMRVLIGLTAGIAAFAAGAVMLARATR